MLAGHDRLLARPLSSETADPRPCATNTVQHRVGRGLWQRCIARHVSTVVQSRTHRHRRLKLCDRSENAKGRKDCRFRQLDISQGALNENSTWWSAQRSWNTLKTNTRRSATCEKCCAVFDPHGATRADVSPGSTIWSRTALTEETVQTLLKSHGIVPVFVRNWGFPFHTLYKHLINLSPGTSMSRFAQQEYGPLERFTSVVLRLLFYLNLGRGRTTDCLSGKSSRRIACARFK